MYIFLACLLSNDFFQLMRIAMFRSQWPVGGSLPYGNSAAVGGKQYSSTNTKSGKSLWSWGSCSPLTEEASVRRQLPGWQGCCDRCTDTTMHTQRLLERIQQKVQINKSINKYQVKKNKTKEVKHKDSYLSCKGSETHNKHHRQTFAQLLGWPHTAGASDVLRRGARRLSSLREPWRLAAAQKQNRWIWYTFMQNETPFPLADLCDFVVLSCIFTDRMTPAALLVRKHTDLI